MSDTAFTVLVYVASSLYIIIAIVFADLTIREGIEKKLFWNGYRLLGIIASTIWPIVMLLAIYEVRRARKISSSFAGRRYQIRR